MAPPKSIKIAEPPRLPEMAKGEIKFFTDPSFPEIRGGEILPEAPPTAFLNASEFIQAAEENLAPTSPEIFLRKGFWGPENEPSPLPKVLAISDKKEKMPSPKEPGWVSEHLPEIITWGYLVPMGTIAASAGLAHLILNHPAFWALVGEFIKEELGPLGQYLIAFLPALGMVVGGGTGKSSGSSDEIPPESQDFSDAPLEFAEELDLLAEEAERNAKHFEGREGAIELVRHFKHQAGRYRQHAKVIREREEKEWAGEILPQLDYSEYIDQKEKIYRADQNQTLSVEGWVVNWAFGLRFYTNEIISRGKKLAVSTQAVNLRGAEMLKTNYLPESPDKVRAYFVEAGIGSDEVRFDLRTNQRALVFQIHESFVDHYRKTGSAKAALDWLVKSSWGSLVEVIKAGD